MWKKHISPCKDQIEGIDVMEWSKHMEFTRKDIICVFGMMEKCFYF